MPIGTGIVYNVGDLILSQVSSSGTAFLETKIAAATSSLIYFDSTARINSASLNSITVGTASYVSGSRSIITNLTASNISASGTSSFGYVGIGTTNPTQKLHIQNGYLLIDTNATVGSGLWMPDTNGNPSLRIVTDQSSANFSSIINNWGANTNSGVMVGTVRNDGTAFQVRSGVTVTSGFANDDGTTRFTVNGDGNVGIGTTSPANKLHVAGLMTQDSSIVYSKVNTITTNNPIRITIPFTKINTGADFIVKVKAIAMANNSSGVNYLDYVGYSGYTFNFNTNLTTIEKYGNVTVNSYVSASSATAGNLYVELDGVDGFTQDSNWTIQTNILGNSMYSTFDSGSITTFVTSISEDSLETSFNKYFGGNVGIGTTSPADKLHVYNGSSHFEATSNGNAAIVAGLYALQIGPLHDRDSTAGRYYGGIAFNHLLNFGGGTTYNGAPQAWIGTRLQDTTGSERDYLVFATKPGTGVSGTGNDIPIERMCIDRDGNVGIGTSSPGYKLDVLGDLRISGSTSTIATFKSSASNCFISLIDSSGDNVFLGNDDGDFLIQTPTSAYSTKLIVKDDGNVGIGTTVPVNKLQVNGNVSGSSFTSSISNAVGFLGTSSWAQNVVSASFATTAQTANALNTGNSYTIAGLTNNGTLSQNGNLSMGSGNQILATQGSAPIPGIAFVGDTNTGIYLPSADTIGFSISGSERVRIDSVGNVGIGTTSPFSGAELDVYGDIVLANQNWSLRGNNGNGDFAIEELGASFNDSNIKFYIVSGGNVGIGTIVPTQKLEVQGNVQIGNDNVTNIGLRLTRLNGGFRTSEHTFHSSQNSPWYTYGQNLTWTNELAGTVEPTQVYRPYFEGFAPAVGYKVFGFMNVNTGSFTSANVVNSLVLKNDGNVGIGTTDPATKLHLSGTGTTELRIASTTSNTNSLLSFYELALASWGIDAGQANGSFFIKDLYNTRTVLTLNSSGNVGIGTTNPAAKLEITGSSNSGLLHIKSPISGAIVYVSGSGAVGIGTSAIGAFTLQVSGSFGATTKSFIIEHPTKAGKKLMYGSLESPYHGIRLTGRDTIKDGKCKVELPDYMYKLILHDSINIQLTGIKCNKTLYVDEINIPENYFTIAYDKGVFESYKDYDFFWDFTAIRADVPELNTEL